MQSYDLLGTRIQQKNEHILRARTKRKKKKKSRQINFLQNQMARKHPNVGYNEN
jgi:hypothetical protein